MSKYIIREPFWKTALRLGIFFLIVVLLIELIWELLSSGNLNALQTSLDDGTWINYTVSRLIIGIVYGLTMAYYLHKNAKRKK